ncbi:MAG: prephenate dehydratase [Elusimicrobia bacterium]|nr:prephenate dehydratase [Elusimicrobiota bacterium]
MKVAFQGVRGAYSETALKAHFGPAVEAAGFPFSEQVFEAVEAGRADAGFVPVENSIAGPVGVNMDLLLERDVYAVAEAYLRVEHCLLAPPGTRLESVSEVLSHPVALAQCRAFLEARGLKAVPEYDTAGAAELVARRREAGQAAIAGRDCAAAYGLDVLAEGIQTHADNFTRFLAFTRPDAAPAGLKREKTSLAFAAPHRPGALLHCLERFAAHGVNLTRLESRPVAENPFEYVFFVDFLGGSDAPEAAQALKELKTEARRLKVIGSYPRADVPSPSSRDRRP